MDIHHQLARSKMQASARGEQQKKQRAQDVPEFYSQWKADPSPHATSLALQHLDSTISSGVTSYAGGQADSPMVKSKARELAIDALHSYDPESGAALKSWVHSNLQGLRRYSEDARSPIKVPERVRLDLGAVNRAVREHVAENGYEPTDEHVADATNLSLKRIGYVRGFSRKQITEGQVAEAEESDEKSKLSEAGGYSDPSNWEGLWGQMIRRDMSETDRHIMDMSLGQGAHDAPLSVNDIAAKLNMSQSAVSKRRKHIADRFAEGLQYSQSTLA